MLTQPIAILSIPFPVSNGREMIFCSLPPLLFGGVICQSNLIAVFVSPHSFVSVINYSPLEMSLLGSLDESEGGLKDIYPFRYREDYRTVVKHTGKVPVTVRQLYTCYLEYKNTIKEFFWTLSASYSHNRYNLITERNYKDGNFYLSSVERNHPLIVTP